jgi:hypothetical protein
VNVIVPLLIVSLIALAVMLVVGRRGGSGS